MNDIENIANFEGVAFRERNEAIKLMKLWQDDHFSSYAFDHFDTKYGPKIEFNPNSGYVFLIDEDYQVCIEERGKLVMFITCPECGNEGSESEFDPKWGQDGKCEECKRIRTGIDACYAELKKDREGSE